MLMISFFFFFKDFSPVYEFCYVSVFYVQYRVLKSQLLQVVSFVVDSIDLWQKLSRYLSLSQEIMHLVCPRHTSLSRTGGTWCFNSAKSTQF